MDLILIILVLFLLFGGGGYWGDIGDGDENARTSRPIIMEPE